MLYDEISHPLLMIQSVRVTSTGGSSWCVIQRNGEQSDSNRMWPWQEYG